MGGYILEVVSKIVSIRLKRVISRVIDVRQSAFSGRKGVIG